MKPGLGEEVNQAREPRDEAPSNNNNHYSSSYLWSQLPRARLCAKNLAFLVPFLLHINPSCERRLRP